jgi:hypothetical protein
MLAFDIIKASLVGRSVISNGLKGQILDLAWSHGEEGGFLEAVIQWEGYKGVRHEGLHGLEVV